MWTLITLKIYSVTEGAQVLLICFMPHCNSAGGRGTEQDALNPIS